MNTTTTRESARVTALLNELHKCDRRIAAMTPEERAALMAECERLERKYARMVQRLGRQPRFMQERETA